MRIISAFVLALLLPACGGDERLTETYNLAIDLQAEVEAARRLATETDRRFAAEENERSMAAKEQIEKLQGRIDDLEVQIFNLQGRVGNIEVSGERGVGLVIPGC